MVAGNHEGDCFAGTAASFWLNDEGNWRVVIKTEQYRTFLLKDAVAFQCFLEHRSAIVPLDFKLGDFVIQLLRSSEWFRLRDWRFYWLHRESALLSRRRLNLGCGGLPSVHFLKLLTELLLVERHSPLLPSLLRSQQSLSDYRSERLVANC